MRRSIDLISFQHSSLNTVETYYINLVISRLGGEGWGMRGGRCGVPLKNLDPSYETELGFGDVLQGNQA